MHRGFNNINTCFSWLNQFGYGGFIIMAIGLILILVLAYVVFKRGGLDQSGSKNSESSLDLLQKRFVNGDISKDEYLEKKEILNMK